jgi:hypothetical protein
MLSAIELWEMALYKSIIIIISNGLPLAWIQNLLRFGVALHLLQTEHSPSGSEE